MTGGRELPESAPPPPRRHAADTLLCGVHSPGACHVATVGGDTPLLPARGGPPGVPPAPLQVTPPHVAAQFYSFSIQRDFMFCFWFIMYANVLLINYMCNCTLVATASQRQHIIKPTLEVIELARP